MLASLLFPVVVLLLSLLPSSTAQTIIYADYTSGFSTTLPTPLVNAVAEHTYNTNLPGSYRFGVDWNNDATDQFTIDFPATIRLTAENSVSFCTPNATTNPPNQITFTATSVHQCNYTAAWTTGFSGVMTVTYNGGPNTGNARSDAISTFFVLSSAVVGDPQFVGLRGQSYQVHGLDGAVYNLISDHALQVNSRFTFLSDGECPVIDGVADSNCWSHPGSYMGEMSFQQLVNGRLHQALLVAGDAKKGFAQVQVDGEAVQVGDKVAFGPFSLERTSSHSVTVQTHDFEFVLSNSDRFINQGLRSLVPLTQLSSHGLLGQTHSSRLHAKASIPYLEGEVDDYAILDNDIYGSDFLYNRFHGGQ